MSFEILDRVARPQYGLLTTRQLLDAGLSNVLIRRYVNEGRISPVRRGVYRLCGTQPSWRASALAAVLAAGDGAVLSHRSAGALWGFLDYRSEVGPLEVTSERQLRVRGARGHRHRLAATEVTTRFGIPVTTAERTLLDLAQSVPARQLGSLCDDGLRRRIVTLGRLHAVVAKHGGRGRRRLGPIHEALALRIPGYDPGANDWEQRMDRLWDKLGLPPAERHYRIRARGRNYEVDRAIVSERIAVEWNGHDPHGYRGQIDYDSDRAADLAAAGWYLVAFTSQSTPQRICRSVLALVDARRAHPRPA